MKAVVFDMGGVLIDLDFAKAVESFKALGFDEIVNVLDPYHQKGFFFSLESGAISEQEFYDECKKYVRPGTTSEQIASALMSFCIGVDANKMSYLKELRSRGYGVYCLSNNNPIVVDRFPSLCPSCKSLEDFFDEVFFSYRLKMCKPDEPIYRYAISHIGCDPSEILFIDDSATNIAAAGALGIKGCLYTPGTDLRAAVEPLL